MDDATVKAIMQQIDVKIEQAQRKMSFGMAHYRDGRNKKARRTMDEGNGAHIALNELKDWILEEQA